MTTKITVKKDEFDDKLAIEAAKKASAAAAQKGADSLLEMAQRRVPFLTGTLAGTGTASVDTETGEAAISYDTTYAPILRAHAGDWQFGNGRSGRWLDEAIAEAPNEIMGDMERAASSEWPRG